MSNIINDDNDEIIIKNEPFIDADAEPEEKSKKKILLYYGLTVGTVLFLVLFVFLIAVLLGGTPSNKNSFTSKYISEENTTIKLFNSDYRYTISSMKIDYKKVDISDEYFFSSKGEHRVEVFFKNELTSTEQLFKGCTNLTEIDISHLETRKVTTMAEMFYDCEKLISIDLSKLDTSNVKNMSNLFNGCFNLESINLKNINTSNVEYMDYMFFA